MPLAPGSELGHYEIVSPLGAGGMGEVYRARDPRLGRDVAIKVLPPDSVGSVSARRRFEQEARAVARLSHPNILSIHEFDSDGDVSFAVTELLDGETLRERLDRGPLPWTDAVRIAAAICDGLAAAHAKGIVHRDLKPSNVFITSDGQVKILDFGIARMTAQNDDVVTEVRTTPGTVVGTLGYMSPEQLRGEAVDAGTDIFALGCTAYEMVAGRSPFARATASETNAAILRDDPPLVAGLPPAADRIIRRCLQKEPAQRYRSAHDVAIELRSLSVPPARRLPWALIGAVAAIAIAAVIAALVVRPRVTVPPHPTARSILVVPFENATRDPNVEYLSDGIAEGLIDSLAALPEVRIIARTTAFQYKGKELDLQQIRKQLDVDAVLSGRLVSAANNVVVQADLVDTAGGSELWGSRYHEQSANVLDIEQDIVGRIAGALRLRLTQSAASTQSSEAYKLYLQGRFYWNKRTPEAIRKARDFFEQATIADPKFAVAYSGLADADNMLGVTYKVVPRDEGLRAAREAAETALRLDPNLAEAHASLGLIEVNEFHWAAAERELKRSIAINPNYSNAYVWYSLVLTSEQRHQEALQNVLAAKRADPLSPLVSMNVARCLNQLGRYADGIAEARRGIGLNSAYLPPYELAAMAYERLGRREDAAAMFRQAGAQIGMPGMNAMSLLRAYLLVGNRDEAERIQRAAEQQVRRGEMANGTIAIGYAALGQRDKAIDSLQRSVAAHETPFRDAMIDLTVQTALSGDPRFVSLQEQLKRGFDD